MLDRVYRARAIYNLRPKEKGLRPLQSQAKWNMELILRICVSKNHACGHERQTKPSRNSMGIFLFPTKLGP